ncbi:MAG TPA: diapophytoene dehydrogenase [Sphingobacteriaceae bacterium]|nr:diapophytoene dehydrogenase [Sphingobacteriaceae bacterium]
MARYELLLPKMGESVAEATIIKWVKQPGDVIRIDDEIVEIATDKVDSDVPSPVSGKLVKHLCKENDVVQVGEAIAIIEIEGEPDKPEPKASVEEPDDDIEESYEEISEIPGLDQINKVVERTIEKPEEESSHFYSPLVRSIAAEEGISLQDLDQIKGTGLEGRITKQDILDYIRNNRNPGSAPKRKDPEVPNPQQTTRSFTTETTEAAPGVSVSGNDEIIEMDRMRRLIADHMVMSKRTSPHVTSVVEADVTNLVQWRERIKNDFEKREGEKITFTPIFIEAVAKAIKDFPMINVFVNGTQIIKKRDINIGMATALPSGNLIVPIIKNTDRMSLTGIVKSVNDLAQRARNSKLQPDEVKDGTFTVTNIGSFGNLIGTPIINQPQVAVLAFGAIKKKPAVVETSSGDMIAIRHMMFLSLSYDHRVVDGALGGSFVKRVADYLEKWDIDMEI